ncbi:unnamed protein product [Rhizophagus irregularis]|nr:unnamed protein product [Rhizophagus irregularis]CAB4442384.1 unnamed protein product [Rhizophagus irregularis]
MDRRKKFVSNRQIPCLHNSRKDDLDGTKSTKLYFDAMDQIEVVNQGTPSQITSSSHISNSKEIIEEFINLNEDFSKRLSLQPLVSTKPKNNNLSSDDLDKTKENNKKKRKKKKAITRGKYRLVCIFY